MSVSSSTIGRGGCRSAAPRGASPRWRRAARSASWRSGRGTGWSASIARYPGSATRESLAARDGWERLSAVKGGRVYEVPAGMLKRPGPGLLDGLERLAAMFAEGGET